VRVEIRNGERFLARDVIAIKLRSAYFDLDAKLAAMDRMGIDVAVISCGPPAYCYWLPAAQGARAAQLVNDGIANMLAAEPKRLRGMATLPLQNVDAAVRELERIAKLGCFRGVELGTSVEGALISEPKFRTLLKRIEELGLFVFAHPYQPSSKGGLDRYYLISSMGFPLDTSLLAAHLMASGALDELKTLKFILPHGGGFLPYLIGRLEHAFHARPEPRANTATAPREHLKRFVFDALTHDPVAARCLIDTVGVERVVLGSDCPFDMEDVAPIASLTRVPGLTAAERQRIHSLNALALLGERVP
jgi:aminocarboxymuconate-semialdehyde decarboxylase